MRAEICKEILLKIKIEDGHVRAHRLIGCSETDLRPALGSYWTHDYENWPDPYAPWAEGGREAPTLVIEAMVPVASIDWQTSCMALMDWYCGDSESELRLKPGHPVRLISCMRLQCQTPVVIPDLKYTS